MKIELIEDVGGFGKKGEILEERDLVAIWLIESGLAIAVEEDKPKTKKNEKS